MKNAVEMKNTTVEMAATVETTNSTYRDSIQNSYIPKRVADFCCDYGWSVRKMNKWLHDHGMQFKCATQGSWVPASDLEPHGYVIMKSCEVYLGGGYVDFYCKNYWTPKGRLMIHDKLAAEGIFPIVATEKGDASCESMW